MRPIRNTWPVFVIVFASFLLVTLFCSHVTPRAKETDLTRKKLTLKGFPRAIWRESFIDEVRYFHLAFKSGDVLVYTNNYVWLYDSSGKLLWKQGEGRDWKYITGGGISDDGRKIIFQVNLEKKVATNLLDMDMYYLDREGKLIWVKDNPYRYNQSQLSRTGKYILFGDPIEKNVKVYDQNLNHLWERELYLWYISFDPMENFLFDAHGGLLFNMEGRQVWDVGGLARILSVSDNAEVIISQRFLGRKTTSEMYIVGRVALKKVVLNGAGGCVSPDGSLVAVVTDDTKLKVYRTQELFTSSPEQLPPIFQCDFLKADVLNISRDNMTVLVFGKENMYQRTLMLVGLNQNKVLWKESFPDHIKKVYLTENNKYILVKQDPTTIEMFQAY